MSIKVISLKTHRPDLTREFFREYYESHHVKMGLEFIEHFRWQKYVRNHIEKVTGRTISFDCLTEFWLASRSDQAIGKAFAASPAFAGLDVDDRNFLDISKRCSFEVQEHVLIEGPADGEPAGYTRFSVITQLDEHSSRRGATEIQTLCRRCIDAQTSHIARATLDIPDQPPGALPYEFILSVWIKPDAPLDLSPFKNQENVSFVQFDVVETPKTALYTPLPATENS